MEVHIEYSQSRWHIANVAVFSTITFYVWMSNFPGAEYIPMGWFQRQMGKWDLVRVERWG